MIHEEDRSNENKFSETVRNIFFRAHCQVRGLSIVTYSWIELGICPKKVKFVSNWLEAKEKKNIFLFGKKSWVRNVNKPFFQKS